MRHLKLHAKTYNIKSPFLNCSFCYFLIDSHLSFFFIVFLFSVCIIGVDVVFMLDASLSVGEEGFARSKSFVRQVMSPAFSFETQ